MYYRAGRILTALFLMFATWSGTVNLAKADVLAEYLFWSNMGNAAGSAAKNFSDYTAERDLWRNKIAEGEAKLKACGNCAQRGEIEKELRKWKDTENRFQEIAGQAFVSVGMPPIVGKALGIDIPMAVGSSSAEIRARYRVVRPSWADDRPEFCRQSVNEYIGCLRAYKARKNTLFIDSAKEPGGECYDLRKLFQYCGTENFEAFHTEKELQQKRDEGQIIPEYLDYRNEVYYGEVPEDFMPTLPPEVVLKKLKESDPKHQGVHLSMRKSKEGLLTKMTVRPFSHTLVIPSNRCADPDPPRDELSQRVCDDYKILSWRDSPPVLFCHYSAADLAVPSFFDAFKFWYGETPEYADAERLLTRSSEHPLLTVGEPLFQCPATKDEANALQSQWFAKVSLLRAKTPQTPAEVNLPKPEWLVNQQKDYEKQYEEEMKRREVMKTFPFEGAYTFETTLNGETTKGTCIMPPASTTPGYGFLLQCDYPGGKLTYLARPNSSGAPMVLYWEIAGKRLRMRYLVDESDPDVLVTPGQGTENWGRLVRIGDLVPLTDLQLEGTYRYERSLDGVAESGKCTVSRYEKQQPPPLHFKCISDSGGSLLENTAMERENAFFISWSALEGRAMTGLVFTLENDEFSSRDAALTFVGRNRYGGKVRLVRAGDLPPEAKPEAREELMKRSQEEALKRRQEALARSQQTSEVMKRRAAQPAAADKVEPGRRCALEELAGTYRTGYGPMVCEVSEGRLDCCYSGKCQKKAWLALDQTGRSLEGTWDDTRRKGTVMFPLSAECELETGRWKPSDREAYGAWRVMGRMP